MTQGSYVACLICNADGQAVGVSLEKIEGIRIALSVGVRVPLVARLVLMLTVLAITAARLHAHTVDAIDATQEVNRCLRLLKVAASRRQRLPQWPRIDIRVTGPDWSAPHC